MTVSLIVTILNEQKYILSLLNSFLSLSVKPDEIIIVDGGSTDQTVQLIKSWQKENKLKLVLLQKKGNRSVGRNLAISKAKNDWIAITDAGCTLQKEWLAQLIWSSKGSDVVAGYYVGRFKTNFQQAVIPYALVMPDRVDKNIFLPATRSMMIKKSVWQKIGGFDENLSDNEDYDFAIKIKKAGYKIKFAAKAMVEWIPRSNFLSFLKMIYRFAKGDTYALIFRPKVLLIFVRYLLAILITLGISLFSLKAAIALIVIGLIAYSLWAIKKNYLYVKDGWYFLPLLQIGSDLAVMMGSFLGLVQKGIDNLAHDI